MRGATTIRAAWLPFALCIVLTVTASLLVHHAERQAEQARFARAVAAASQRVRERMASYIALLRGAAGLLSRPEPVTAEEFRLFVDRLDLPAHYPGTLGVGYTVRLGNVPVEEATARVHAAGWTNVQVWPETPRDEVHAIVLLEPLDARNRAALGYDMRTEPTRREAMDRARDEGDVALSGKVTLVQEIEQQKQPGFLLYSPVYLGAAIPRSLADRRAKLKGYVYAPLRAGDLFDGIFGTERPTMTFELYDGEVRGDHLLYRLGPPEEASRERAITTFPVAGHLWTTRFVGAPSGTHAFVLSIEVAALGVLLSIVVLVLGRARDRARAREVIAKAAVLASEETDRIKDMFVAMLGHDLCNPLNAIVLSTEVLQQALADAPGVTEPLGRVRSSTTRMARMIDQMLDLARTRLGNGMSVAPRRVDLGALVRDAVDEIVRVHPAHMVEISGGGDLEGVWDPDRLAQVFSNLIGNAVRYQGGEPVRVVLDGALPDRVVATVHNAGAIPPSLLPVVFEPFRGTPAGRSQGGSPGLGLGLYITRVIVEAHAGSIEVASRDGTGTTFTLTLPRESRPAAGDVPRALRPAT